jgi:hypothetical protein
MLEERRASAVGTTRRRRVQLDSNGERTRSGRRRRHSSRSPYIFDESHSGNNTTIYDTLADMDLEDVLIMEAIRLSLATNNNNSNATNNNNNDTNNDDSTGTNQQQQQQQLSTTAT